MAVQFDAFTMQAVDAMLREASQAEILPRFRHLSPEAVRTKSGPLDLVTDADEAAERQITQALLARFPGAVVVGEEACAADPTLLRHLAEAELSFVVDPVDGTANFAAGVPLFGCMAAAIMRGEVVAAWIHDPLGRDTILAARGAGAWHVDAEGTHTRLRVAAPVKLERMIGAVSWRYFHEPERSRVASRLPRLATTVQFRCAAHEYRLVATGHAHLAMYNRLMPWDHAPGWLIHQEAGGYSARLDGSPYTPTETSGGLIATPDRAGWEAVRDALLAP